MAENILNALSRFKVVRPIHEIDQDTLIHSQIGLYCLIQARLSNRDSVTSEEERKMRRFVSRFACGSDRINRRGVEIDDPIVADAPDRIYGRISRSPHSGDESGHADEYAGACGKGIYRRMQRFQKGALRMFGELYPETAHPPDHIVHVTCTGYVSPSAAQTWVDRRAWNETTSVTHAYHMGCYASHPAIRLASGLAASSSAHPRSVDIVHTEFCSLHMNSADHSPEQIVVASLFADGGIKYHLDAKDNSEDGLEIHSILEYIVPGTLDRMTWTAGDTGMKMTLARDVPERIASSLPGLLDRLAKSVGLSSEMLCREAVFSVHPGGPRIIDATLDLLRLQETQVAQSRSVLRDYGNMSSATLPYIWDRILKDRAVVDGRWIVSLAFGPGLTIFGSLMKKFGKSAAYA